MENKNKNKTRKFRRNQQQKWEGPSGTDVTVDSWRKQLIKRTEQNKYRILTHVCGT